MMQTYLGISEYQSQEYLQFVMENFKIITTASSLKFKTINANT